MIKQMICTQCPRGCHLTVDIENCQVVKVEGNACPQGADYARQEVENPQRVLTSVVKAVGLEVAMVPVRTDKPMPKAKLAEAMDRVKKIRLQSPVSCGQVVEKNFLELSVDLIATRQVSRL